jgi:hypothetical protein
VRGGPAARRGEGLLGVVAPEEIQKGVLFRHHGGRRWDVSEVEST